MDFSGLNKATAKSFNQQKNVIKKVLAGQSVLCPSCKQSLSLTEQSGALIIKCQQGCTDIKLETE